MPAPFLLQTERLSMCQFSLDDAPFILQLLNSEGWIKYIGNRNMSALEEARHYISQLLMPSYATNGFGLWLVLLQPANVPIGMCGLVKRPYLAHIDIGFALLPEYMGCGYAREAVQATLDYTQQVLAQKRIVALTLPENQRSIHLLQEMGFAFEDTIFAPNDNKSLCLFAKTL